jgi:DNA-binding MarR family transcriptional regulator
VTESLGAQLATAFGEVIQRGTRSRLYDSLTRHIDAVDEATYPVVSALARTGPRTAAQLAADIGLDRSVVSRHGDRLVAAGLLQRTPDPGDKRGTLLSLTAQGAAQVAVMRGRLHRAFDTYLATWPAEDARTFVELFQRFVTDGPFGAPD